MSHLATIRVTACFEQDLDSIEAFLTRAGMPQAFDGLLEELAATVFPNLQRFPGLGRPFQARMGGSVESRTGMEHLAQQLTAIDQHAELREYVMRHYLLLYARIDTELYLLSLRHQRQLSFNFDRLWHFD